MDFGASDPMSETTKTQVDRKARLKIPPPPVPKQDPKQRVKNWQEVYLGYDLPAARIEATRCIQCPAAPCQKACPLHNDIPGALLKLEEGDVMGAAEVFRATNPAPDMCGRLCPQESLCEGDCVVGKVAIPVAIGKLEAFIADQQQAAGRQIPELPTPTGKRVAVVGSGPAGLAVAEQLALRGHGVKVFEAWPRPGGVLRYGIPGFKMDKGHVDDEVEHLHRLGVQFAFNVRVGYDVTIDALFAEGFHAVFLGQGAGQGNRLNVPGEELAGIHMATEFLVRLNLSPEAERGGREEERRHANEEGVRFHYLTAPIRFVADGGRVQAVRFQRMELGEPDDSGRPRPVPVIGSEFDEPADTVVIAIGYKVERLLFQTTPELKATEWGTVAADEGGQTSRAGVFAAGDSVRGADLVVTALADASRAAKAIDGYLRGEKAAA